MKERKIEYKNLNELLYIYTIMHFCNKCENMLYIRLLAEDSDSLVYYCRNCGETDETITKENICVFSQIFVDNRQIFCQNLPHHLSMANQKLFNHYGDNHV